MDNPLSMARSDDMQQHYLEEEAKSQEMAVADIRFNIENLLSPDNLMDTSKVKILQNLLNRFVYGMPKLEEDGQVGHQTVRAIKTYQQESRYWGGHTNVTINPLENSKAYDMYFEDIPESPMEGGGDQGR
tara:strand:+ start:48 stop:437 length:390 start_codon:yes stop_codon:yes gene_type:complete